MNILTNNILSLLEIVSGRCSVKGKKVGDGLLMHNSAIVHLQKNDEEKRVITRFGEC